ncbi:MAG TPA: tetratricopeptide repeat protein [Candidatus Paceibacterota bacterium]
MEEREISSPRRGHNRGLFAILALATFLLPIALVPWGVFYQGADKTFIFIIFAILACIFWIIARIVDGQIVFPRSMILLGAVFVTLAYLLAAIFSVNSYNSFSGTLFDNGTYWVIFLLMVLIYLSSIAVKTFPRVVTIFSAIFGAGIILFLSGVLHLILGWNFGILGPDKTSNLLGSWYSLISFFGLIVVIALAFLEFGPALSFWRKVSFLFLILSLLAVFVGQLMMTWIIILAFTLLIFLFKLVMMRKGGGTFPLYALVLILLSFVFILLGGSGTKLGTVADNIIVAPVEVRPSWQGTYSVVKASVITRPILGFGPNLFSRAWVRYKPLSVNTSEFWSTDFNHGVGYIAESLVTVGILGFLAWLFFLFAIFRLATRRATSPFFYPAIFGSLYVWVLAFVYIPDLVLLAMGAILTGMAMAIATMDGNLNVEIVSTRLHSRNKYLAILILVILLLGSLSIGYLYIQKYRALGYQKEADRVVGSDLVAALRALDKATSIDKSELYYRSIAQANLSILANLVANPGNTDNNILNQEFLRLYNEALKAARLAVEIDPSGYINWVLLGNVYESATPLGVDKAYENAKDAYNRAAIENPTSPFVAFEPARLEAAHNNPKGAVDYLNRSINLKPNYSRAYIFAAQLALSRGDLETAIETSEQGVKVAPGDFSVYFQLGYLLFQKGDYNRSVTILEQSISLNPQYANAKYFLGLGYDKIGRSKDAVKIFSEILSTNPENSEIAHILGNLRAGRAALSE